MATSNLGEGVEGEAEVFGKKVAAGLLTKAIDDALKMCLGTTEGIVMTSIGNDDIIVGNLRGSIDELLAQMVKAYAVFSLKSLGLVLDADDGLVVAHGNDRVGHAWLCHHQDDLGTLGSCYGAVYTHQLYLVVSMANACGIDEAEGNATQLDGVFDGVARSALDVADDGALFT